MLNNCNAISCVKNELSVMDKSVDSTTNPADRGRSNIVTYNRNLTIVYFIPFDLDTIANWNNRFDSIFTYAQNWYGEQMETAEYGYKTFGIVKDTAANKVQIVLIRSKDPKASYGTSADAYANEIKDYFNAHPGINSSNQVLIMLPAFGYDNNSTEGPQPLEGVQPFYGYYKWCFAMDNIYMSMTLKGVQNPGRNNFAKCIGV